jgi:cysteine-rich repeat protein
VCDDGNTVTETSCPYGTPTCMKCDAACQTTLNLTGPYCGDGIKNGSEACDDGNTVTETSCPYGEQSCTACKADCSAIITPSTVSFCGDGVKNGPEACDDGNTVTEAGCPYGQASCMLCNATCTTVLSLTGPFCGDGTVNGPEVCDDANGSACGLCSAGCDEVTPLSQASGTITTAATAGAGHLANGDTITISDGPTNPVVFEFRTSGSAGVGHIGVDVSGGSLSASQVADALITAIGTQSATLNVSAYKAAAQPFVVLINNAQTGLGNVPLTQMGSNNFGLAGMLGGAGRDCATAVHCTSNDDCKSQSCTGSPTKSCGP